MAMVKKRNGTNLDEFWSDLPEEFVRGRVLSLVQAAAYCKLSLPTFERVLAAGQGPVTCKLSERRRGCRLKHLDRWLDERTEAGEVA
jgi:predicted DNA-binding transcriptional regulator AlpA